MAESTLGAPSYSLTEKLTLPENFETDLGAQLVAVAAAQVAPASEQAGTYLVDLLQPVAARLERLVDNPPAGLGAERVADLQFSLALATQTIGEQSGEGERLEQAVAAYHAALEEWTRERVPLDWAVTQINLGTALRRLGERESGTGAPRARRSRPTAPRSRSGPASASRSTGRRRRTTSAPRS